MSEIPILQNVFGNHGGRKRCLHPSQESGGTSQKTSSRASELPCKGQIGVRLCGKTTILYKVAEHLTSQGVRAKDIMFLNFDDPSIKAASFDELQKEIFKINPDISHLFLD